MSKTITFHEALDEFWAIFFYGLKSLFVLLSRTVYVLSLIAFTLCMHFSGWAFKVRLNLENWQPVKPAIFGLE